MRAVGTRVELIGGAHRGAQGLQGLRTQLRHAGLGDAELGCDVGHLALAEEVLLDDEAEAFREVGDGIAQLPELLAAQQQGLGPGASQTITSAPDSGDTVCRLTMSARDVAWSMSSTSLRVMPSERATSSVLGAVRRSLVSRVRAASISRALVRTERLAQSIERSSSISAPRIRSRA